MRIKPSWRRTANGRFGPECVPIPKLLERACKTGRYESNDDLNVEIERLAGLFRTVETRPDQKSEGTTDSAAKRLPFVLSEAETASREELMSHLCDFDNDQLKSVPTTVLMTPTKEKALEPHTQRPSPTCVDELNSSA